MRSIRPWLGLGALAALLLTHDAPSAASRGETPAGSELAGAALVHASDLGSGWSTSAAAPRRVPPLTCSRFDPAIPKEVTETGAAGSSTYEQSSGGPFVQQDAHAYASARQEQVVWGKVVRPALLRCVEQALRTGSGSGVSFTVSRGQPLALPKLAASAAAYRVHGTASGAGQTVDVYLDVLLLGRGNAISSLSISSFDSPPARRLELRLARAAARRLPAG